MQGPARIHTRCRITVCRASEDPCVTYPYQSIRTCPPGAVSGRLASHAPTPGTQGCPPPRHCTVPALADVAPGAPVRARRIARAGAAAGDPPVPRRAARLGPAAAVRQRVAGRARLRRDRARAALRRGRGAGRHRRARAAAAARAQARPLACPVSRQATPAAATAQAARAPPPPLPLRCHSTLCALRGGMPLLQAPCGSSRAVGSVLLALYRYIIDTLISMGYHARLLHASSLP